MTGFQLLVSKTCPYAEIGWVLIGIAKFGERHALKRAYAGARLSASMLYGKIVPEHDVPLAPQSGIEPQ